VRAIEAELGTPLVVRLARGVRLTGAGLQFLEHGRRILREMGRLEEELHTATAAARGRVILGLTPTIGPLLLPGVIERVQRQCPQVTLRIVEWFSSQLYDGMLAGRVDVAVLTNPPQTRLLKLTPLLSEPIVVLAAPQARGSRRYYTVPELARTPVITSATIRAIIDDQLKRYGARLQVRAEIDAIEAIRRLLLRGLCTSVMPVSTFSDDIAAGRICAMPIADISVHRLLALAQQSASRLSAAVEEISRVVTAEINAQSDLGTFGVPGPPAAPRRVHRRRGG
jgi:DNA-binding transcriptional LysR family regulator